MDYIAEVAVGLAGLHRRSPAAAMSTSRWLVRCAPGTTRAVAVTYAHTVAEPMREQRAQLERGGDETIVSFQLFSPGGAPITPDAADPVLATIARMVAACGNSDPGGAAAAWDAFASTASTWQRMYALNRLACYAGGH